MCSDGSACYFYYHDVINSFMENKLFFTARGTEALNRINTFKTKKNISNMKEET